MSMYYRKLSYGDILMSSLSSKATVIPDKRVLHRSSSWSIQAFHSDSSFTFPSFTVISHITSLTITVQ